MPGLLHVDYAWRSTDIDDASQSRCGCQNAYGLLNAMATVDLTRWSLQFGLWVQNLGNERYFAQWVDTGDIFVGMPGAPRTYGGSVTYRFSGH
jgi:outer membrane receptor protein involved in Fe transport